VVRAGLATGGLQFLAGEGAVLVFPFGDGRKPVAHDEGTAGCCGHPGRHADALGSGSGDYLGVDVSIDGDRGSASASVIASQLASTLGMISCFSRFMSSSVFETGTSWKGGQRSGIVSPASR